MNTTASDGTPLIPRYYTQHTAPHMTRAHDPARDRTAADAAAGLARLEQIAAQQHLATAQTRLQAARERVSVCDTAHLGAAVRQWCRLRASTPP